MKILLALFYLAMNIVKKNELTKILYSLDSNERDFLKGFDARNISKEESSINLLIDLHKKHALLTKLTNEKTHCLEKERLAKEYLEEQLTIEPNLSAGALMKDWEFEI